MDCFGKCEVFQHLGEDLVKQLTLLVQRLFQGPVENLSATEIARAAGGGAVSARVPPD